MSLWARLKKEIFPPGTELVVIFCWWRDQLKAKEAWQWAELLVALIFSCVMAWKSVEAPQLFSSDSALCKSGDDPHSLSSDLTFAAVSRKELRGAPARVHLFTVDPDTMPQPRGALASEAVDPRCKSRAFLTELIPAIAETSPVVIALDQHYDNAGCPPGINEAFVAILNAATVLDASGQPKPARFVMGMTTESPGRSRGDKTGACLEQAAQGLIFSVDDTAPPDVPVNSRSTWRFYPSSGRLDSDTSQIPLSWRTHLDAVGHMGLRTDSVDTFALRTAELAQPEVENDALLRDFKSQAYNPFGRFLPGDAMQSPALKTDAMVLLCASAHRQQFEQGWQYLCPAQRAPVPHLGGQAVAVVGVLDTGDMHPFLGHSAYGVELQAQYIEALMTRSYFKAVGWNAERYGMIALITAATALIWLTGTAYLQAIFIIAMEFLLLGILFVITIAAHYFPPHIWYSLAAVLSPLPWKVIEFLGTTAMMHHRKEKPALPPTVSKNAGTGKPPTERT